MYYSVTSKDINNYLFFCNYTEAHPEAIAYSWLYLVLDCVHCPQVAKGVIASGKSKFKMQFK